MLPEALREPLGITCGQEVSQDLLYHWAVTAAKSSFRPKVFRTQKTYHLKNLSEASAQPVWHEGMLTSQGISTWEMLSCASVSLAIPAGVQGKEDVPTACKGQTLWYFLSRSIGTAAAADNTLGNLSPCSQPVGFTGHPFYLQAMWTGDRKESGQQGEEKEEMWGEGMRDPLMLVVAYH